MADGIWQGVYLEIFGRSRQILLRNLFDLSTPFIRKGRDEGEKNGEKKKRLMKILATTSFASSRPPERRPLERRTLMPIQTFLNN